MSPVAVLPGTLARPLTSVQQHWRQCPALERGLVSPTPHRNFASASTEKDSGAASEAELAAEKSKLRNLTGVGTVLGLGAISYGSWWMISTAMSTIGAVYAKPHLVAYAGFWFGFGSATVCAALALGVYRLSFIRPEFAFKDSFQLITGSSEVQARLGSNIQDTRLRSYEISGGRVSLASVMPKWIPHEVQLMYAVKGEKGTGLVTALCVKRPSLVPKALDIDLLAVDLKDQETLMLKGDKSQLVVRDNIHQLLDIKLSLLPDKRA